MRAKEKTAPSVIYIGGRKRQITATAMRRHETDTMYNRRGQLVTGQDIGTEMVVGKRLSSRHYWSRGGPKPYPISGWVYIHDDGVIVSLCGYGDKPCELHYRGSTEANLPRIEGSWGSGSTSFSPAPHTPSPGYAPGAWRVSALPCA